MPGSKMDFILNPAPACILAWPPGQYTLLLASPLVDSWCKFRLELLAWWCSCRGRGANPMAQVLQAIGEDLDLLEYDNWQILLPEGTFMTEVQHQLTIVGLQQASCCKV